MADDKTTPAAASSPRPAEPSTPAAGSPQIATTPAVASIEVDDTEETSSLQDGYESGTDRSSNASTSLASSVRDYNWENKRRYHKFREGRYTVPNDEAEQDREDMKHALVIHICGGVLHSAPLENTHKILDIGTGTGIWAIESKRPLLL